VPRDWEQIYSSPADLDFTPSPLLVELADRLQPARALDLACGHGRNTLYLARLGWQVTAVDSSPAAIRLVLDRAAGLSVDAHVADLASGAWPIPPDSYDLICDFLYLERSLFPAIRQAVVPGGLFVASILVADTPGNFELHPGELRRYFADWKILFYSESLEAGQSRRTARLIARR